MKYLFVFILLTSTIILNWCFFWEDEVGSWLELTQKEGFSLQLPNSWSEIQSSKLPIPKSGTVELAYASSEARQWYINNIVVLSSSNSQRESSSSLMKNNGNFLNQQLDDFDLAEEKNIVFPDEDQWILLRFMWKYNSSTPQAVYLQTAKNCGEKSYYITLSITETPETYERYEHLLESFQCSE